MNTVVKHRSSGPLAFVIATSLDNLTSASSITSPALTMTAGDFVYVECLFSAGTTTITTTSTPSNTWHELTSSGAAIGGMQPAYAFSVGAGSTTFTCNYSPASAVQIIIVLQYHPGFLSAFDVETVDLGSSSGTNVQTPSSFTTTAQGLIIVCGHDDSTTPTWSAGLIGSTTATLRRADLTLACEDTMPNAAQGAIKGALTLSSSANWIVHAKAFK